MTTLSSNDEPPTFMDWGRDRFLFLDRYIEFVMDLDITYWFKLTQVCGVLGYTSHNINRTLIRHSLLHHVQKLETLRISMPAGLHFQSNTRYINQTGLLLLTASYQTDRARLFLAFLLGSVSDCLHQSREAILLSRLQAQLQDWYDSQVRALEARFVQPTRRRATRFCLKIISKPNDPLYPYYAIRRQYRDIDWAYEQLKASDSRFIGSRSILDLEDVPNAVNLFNLLNEHQEVVQRYMNHFKTSLSEEDLKTLIRRCVGYPPETSMD